MTTGGGRFAGVVSRLWRYPVKSMLGEELDAAEVLSSGLFGNRSYALLDVETSRLVSAKSPAKWARMFECRSKLLSDGKNGATPDVQITLPGGEHLHVSNGHFAEVEKALSSLFGRRVKLIAARPEPMAITIEQYHPKIEEDPDGGKTTEYRRSLDAQAGTFTDLAAVHIITTASLEALSDLCPSDFDPLRFRPDLLFDTGEAEGFVETSWIERTLAIGDQARFKVFKECGRCVMTTLPQRGLSADAEVLRTIMRHNRGKLGVYASVVKGGRVKKGDRIELI